MLIDEKWFEYFLLDADQCVYMEMLMDNNPWLRDDQFQKAVYQAIKEYDDRHPYDLRVDFDDVTHREYTDDWQYSERLNYLRPNVDGNLVGSHSQFWGDVSTFIRSLPPVDSRNSRLISLTKEQTEYTATLKSKGYQHDFQIMYRLAFFKFALAKHGYMLVKMQDGNPYGHPSSAVCTVRR